jgi:hypothetical protein
MKEKKRINEGDDEMDNAFAAMTKYATTKAEQKKDEDEINKKYDLAVSSGVAGNQGGPADHPTKLKKYLQLMYDCSNTAMVNFPSTWATIRSNNIEYFSPSSTLEIALSVTENVTLIHKTKSDFLIVLSK